MSKVTRTSIEWTDYSANPIKFRLPSVERPINLCVPVSPGCANCYASGMSHRFRGVDYAAQSVAKATLEVDEECLRHMLTFRPRGPFRNGSARPRVFVCDMTDLFGEWVPFDVIGRLFDVFWKRPDVDWQVLTKRPERMYKFVRDHASSLEFNWGDRINHPPMNHGDVFSVYNNELRNNCGWCYIGDDCDNDSNCQHPSREGGYCDAKQCPIGDPVDGKSDLLATGYSDGDFEWTRDDDGIEYTEEPRDIRLHTRPLAAFTQNAWLGTSAENQSEFDKRIDWMCRLREVAPHATLFLSIEPLIGPVDISAAFERAKFSPLAGSSAPSSKAVIDWVIVGGESGHGARPCNVAWIRSIVQQCKAAGTAVFVKQLGAEPYSDTQCYCGHNTDGHWKGPSACFNCGGRLKLRDRKGGDPAEWPEDLRVRDLPQIGGGA